MNERDKGDSQIMALRQKHKLKLPALDPETVKIPKGSAYPKQYKGLVAGRNKRALGNALGLTNFGVNLVRLAPGAWSAIRHWHRRQDEFVYILEGKLVLITDEGEQTLGPGMAAGFPAASANGHHLVNRSRASACYLEVGDRSAGDDVVYPNTDLAARHKPMSYEFTHKDGRPY